MESQVGKGERGEGKPKKKRDGMLGREAQVEEEEGRLSMKHTHRHADAYTAPRAQQLKATSRDSETRAQSADEEEVNNAEDEARMLTLPIRVSTPQIPH